MNISFFGAAGTVTGSCFLLKSDEGYNILIDCGLFQGRKEVKERNYGDFEFEPSEIDVLLLTHSHIDHSGLIPKLCKHGFTGKIYTTTVSKELCSILLPDSAHIQEMEVERKNRKLSRANKPLLEPIYTVEDAEKSMKYFLGVNYDENVEILPGIFAKFRDAGHILGSAMIELFINDKKIVFSGDIGNINQPIINDPSVINSADYIIMESTYGNRFHFETEDKLVQFARIINRTHKKGGNLVIPAFAIERTQDLIYDLKKLIDAGEIPEMDIYIDSPLAIKATEIFARYPSFYDDEAVEMINKNGTSLFEFPNLKFSLSAEDSIKLNTITKNTIILSASGMCDAGRIKHHLKHNLWRKNATVLFVGYQAQGTLGRRILEGEKSVKIHGEEIAINAEIQKIEGFSAHADQKGLIDWVKKYNEKPQKIFIVHGEPESRDKLASVIKEEIGIETILPEFNSTFSLSEKEFEKQEETIFEKEIEIKAAFMDLQNRIRELRNKNISKDLINEEIEKLKEILNKS